jgi:hypothetical protein
MEGMDSLFFVIPAFAFPLPLGLRSIPNALQSRVSPALGLGPDWSKPGFRGAHPLANYLGQACCNPIWSYYTFAPVRAQETQINAALVP